jgi:3-dehydroquinate synthase
MITVKEPGEKFEIPEGIIITDRNIKKYYSKLIDSRTIVIPPGEKSKSLAMFEKVVKKISNAEVIIALGGGVVGDLTGFVAATYKRGIRLIQIPTTLLAMIDSSIGGKNGVNILNKKNYIGTFHLPEEIIINVNFLKTLPKKEFSEGVAEMIKYWYMFNTVDSERLLRGIKKSDGDLKELIKKCAKQKQAIVEKDLEDKGIRHTLNFGHTVGHALELDYKLSHGKAISIGMIKEAEIAYRLGLIEKGKLKLLREILLRNNLPVELKGIKGKKVIRTMLSDKKGKLIFALTRDNFSEKVNSRFVREALI